MTRAFADTVYWVARINPRYQWHAIYQPEPDHDTADEDLAAD